MRYQLVLQGDQRSLRDYDAMVKLEQKIEHALTEGDIVDGHDAGSGEWNVFLEVTDPISAWGRIVKMVEDGLGNVRAAYREIGGETYTPLFPPGLSTFSVR